MTFYYIPGANMFLGTEKVLFTSSDDKYKYSGSVVAKKFKIRTVLNKKNMKK